MPERLDRVQVVSWNGTVVETTTAGRDAVFRQLIRHAEDVGHELRTYGLLAFATAVDASGPVNLDRYDAASVLSAIRALAEQAGGVNHLEPGLAELQRVLDRELRAA